MNKLFILCILLLMAVSLSSRAQIEFEEVFGELTEVIWLNSKFEKVERTDDPMYGLFYIKEETGLYRTKLYCIYENPLCDHPEGGMIGSFKLIESGQMSCMTYLVRQGDFRISNIKGYDVEIKTYNKDTLKQANPKWKCKYQPVRGEVYYYNDIKVVSKPQFPGGEKALKAYIKNHLKYPEELQHSGTIKGTAYVRFVINKFGKVVEPELLRGLNPHFDAEALRLIHSLPDWQAGKDKEEKALNVYYVVPFKLE